MLFVRSVEKKYMVGFDLGDRSIQMSYSCQGSEPVTFSTAGDREEYDIPAFLFKKKGENIWYFGTEAIRASSSEEGDLVSDIPVLCMYESGVRVDGETYEPWLLLALFVNKCLALLFEKIHTGETVQLLSVACFKRKAVKLAEPFFFYPFIHSESEHKGLKA